MSDGHLNSCKGCRRAYQRSRPYDKESEQRRNQTERRKAFHAASLKRWRRENPQKMVVQLARRRARKLNAEGDFTTKEFRTLCEAYGNRCLRCGRDDVRLTPDHVIPVSLGGGNLITNKQLLCGRCNSRKNVKVVDYRLGTPSL